MHNFLFFLRKVTCLSKTGTIFGISKKHDFSNAFHSANMMQGGVIIFLSHRLVWVPSLEIHILILHYTLNESNTDDLTCTHQSSFFPPTVTSSLLFSFTSLSSPFLRCVLARLPGNSGAPVSVSLRSRLEKQSITPKSSPDPAPKSQPSCLIGPLPCQSPKSIVSDGRMALSSCWNNMKDIFSTCMQICVCVEPNGCVFPRVVVDV